MTHHTRRYGDNQTKHGYKWCVNISQNFANWETPYVGVRYNCWYTCWLVLEHNLTFYNRAFRFADWIKKCLAKQLGTFKRLTWSLNAGSWPVHWSHGSTLSLRVILPWTWPIGFLNVYGKAIKKKLLSLCLTLISGILFAELGYKRQHKVYRW